VLQKFKNDVEDEKETFEKIAQWCDASETKGILSIF